MKGFTSKQDLVRYGHLFALSSLLSSKDFWFDDALYEACEAKDYQRLRELLVEAAPPLKEFADVIDWRQLAESAVKVHEFGKKEHHFLEGHVERLTLLAKKINLLDAEDEDDVL